MAQSQGEYSPSSQFRSLYYTGCVRAQSIFGERPLIPFDSFSESPRKPELKANCVLSPFCHGVWAVMTFKRWMPPSNSCVRVVTNIWKPDLLGRVQIQIWESLLRHIFIPWARWTLLDWDYFHAVSGKGREYSSFSLQTRRRLIYSSTLMPRSGLTVAAGEDFFSPPTQ